MSEASDIWGRILSLPFSESSTPPNLDRLDVESVVSLGQSIHCLEWVDHLAGTELENLPDDLYLASKRQRSRTRVFNGALSELIEQINDRQGPKPLIILKGGAFLRDGIYPPGVRRMGDLDLLIRRSKLKAWDHHFQKLGFNPYLPGPFEDLESLPDDCKTLSYYGTLRGRETAIDVHWHLLDSIPHRKVGLWNFSMDPIRQSARNNRLAPEHRFIFTALHAFKHRYQYWKSLVDLKLLEWEYEFDADCFDREATRMNAAKLLHLTQTVFNTVFDVSLTVPWSEPPTLTPAWRAMEERIAHRVVEQRTGILDTLVPSLKLLKGWTTRLRYLSEVFSPPLWSFKTYQPSRRRLLEGLRLYGHHNLAILRSLKNQLLPPILPE